MKSLFVSMALFTGGLAAVLPAFADHDEESREGGVTLAVYGDAPYGCKAPSCGCGAG